MSSNQVSPALIEKALAEFKRAVQITKDVRFQANLRLSTRQRFSAYIVSLLSLFVIGLSLLPNIFQLQDYQSQILLACSIVLSVFVIFTSLIDGAQNFFHQGELLHQCARQIATVSHELKSVDVADPGAAQARLDELQKKYQKALDDCPINHENADYYKEIAGKPSLFPEHYDGKFKWRIRTKFKILYWSLSHGWMAPHVAAVIIIAAVVYLSISGSPYAGTKVGASADATMLVHPKQESAGK